MIFPLSFNASFYVFYVCLDDGLTRAQVELGPGSVLYFPAGMWHRVECTEDSISINISLVGSTWADLIADATRQLMCVVSYLFLTALSRVVRVILRISVTSCSRSLYCCLCFVRLHTTVC